MWAYQFAMMQFCAEKNGWTKFVAMQVSFHMFFLLLLGELGVG
jgi:hypothetical protein